MITVVGWPRSGTHWLKAMLEVCLGEEVQQSHAIDHEGVCVYIVRDPRDVFLSHWKLYLHDHPGRPYSQAEHLEHFFKGREMSRFYFRIGWKAYTEMLVHLAGKSLVRYERLWAITWVVLKDTFRWLGYSVPESTLQLAIDSTSGVRCDPSTLPVEEDMGLPGKWKGQLEPVVLQGLYDYCGDLMDTLRYGRESG